MSARKEYSFQETIRTEVTGAEAEEEWISQTPRM
jgi:hypothetical protein